MSIIVSLVTLMPSYPSRFLLFRSTINERFTIFRPETVDMSTLGHNDIESFSLFF